MGYIWGLGRALKTVLGSAHIVEQLLFYIVLSVLSFDFDLILGPCLTFGSPNGLFLGLG